MAPHDAQSPTIVIDPVAAAPTLVRPPTDLPKSDAALVPVPPGMDWPLFGTVVALMSLGIVMAFSASIYVALHNFNGDESHFLVRHLSHAGIALFVMLVAIRVPYQIWRPLAYPLLLTALAGLVAVLLWGKTVNNATRWLIIGGFPFQPAEFSKVAFVIYLAHSLEKKVSAGSVGRFSVGFVPHALVWCIAFALCMREPDLGTGIVLAVLLFSLCYVAGTNMAYVVLLGLVGLVGLSTYIMHNPMRLGRIVAFLHPEETRGTTGFQLWRFITYQFLHANLNHLLFNMLTLFFFGGMVEQYLGKKRYLAFYLLCGVVAAFGQIVAAPTSMLPTIGASGAIAGVMGAYFVLYPQSRVLTLIPLIIFWDVIELPAVFLLGFWFVMQLVNAGAIAVTSSAVAGGGVAFMAHVAGFVAGVAGVFVFRKRQPPAEWMY